MATLDKIIKNTTGSDIPLNEVGLTIEAGTSYTLVLDEYLRWATPEVITELTTPVNAGDLVINDGTNDLSASDGLRFMEYADRHYVEDSGVNKSKVNVITNYDTGLQVTDNGNGKVTVDVLEGEGIDNGMIAIKCVSGTSCVESACVLVDNTVCYIKKEEC